MWNPKRDDNAQEVPPYHSDQGSVRIALSALIRLADWMETRRTSIQGGYICHAANIAESPPAITSDKWASSHRDRPPVDPPPRGQPPDRHSDVPPHPRSKSARKQQRGGQP